MKEWLDGVSSVAGMTGDTIYWEYITSVKPHWLKGYSCTFPARALSGQQQEGEEYYMITALTADPLVYWDSEIEVSRGPSAPPYPASELSSMLNFRYPPKPPGPFAFPAAPEPDGRLSIPSPSSQPGQFGFPSASRDPE
jgi:hypothetical protein